ncbi:MAG: hypothetical protein HYY36_07265 [Gammaproteobacteria bacterium]|nr:hypothetical protein [Gammaproteobacteria bacterium]
MDKAQLIAVLLSWASHLSGYPYPDTVPAVEQRSAEFFVEKACGGHKNCRVAAWYDDDGTIYLDDRIPDLEEPIVRSVIVHELVHYLQDLSGKYVDDGCEQRLAREREAYSIQRIYLNRIAGRFAATYPVFTPCSANQ